MDPPSGKEELRRRCLAHRAALDHRTRMSRDDRRTEHAMSRLLWAHKVALYLSRGDEPDTVDLADTLIMMGKKVLAPVLTDGHGRSLHEPAWAWYDSKNIRTGLWQIPEPIAPILPASAIDQVEVVLCSALFVDRSGYRVGVGGGWYDRVLVHRADDVPVWAVVNDDEILDEVPHDPWDEPVTAALTPSGLHVLGQ
ncbi:5-formyltetrahydrofolate cyclo-ligase [Cutibacterium acnes]|uniref:5-formyltetrahydrofolate cyclo-ligase n=1 Tax=Cutibacterium acnes TaxID=1747 RepID=UPI00020DEB96|nr:5-formyltetrahydrofolate cyclo-ligase [Cutibacterium acnes]EGL44214.1 5-formyltetrahydrofolate cyclo-ligase [Propionibacterium sp. 434-HC2]MCM4178709.1 5-formyltetrahydrofolate cyclo-ligase [Cutibacterium acnes P03]MCM4183066.1 5-formyltetrahydrofolate cyclo-ligase [Cutibacterium acnes P06B]ESS80283.1 5-formyltetrahydrofolate cyclo-ligase [Cutibacterium acnes PA2]MBU5186201.1 5-formyltetrahydrofolate cyclo-ligase [Cutibacterium acnes]